MLLSNVDSVLHRVGILMSSMLVWLAFRTHQMRPTYTTRSYLIPNKVSNKRKSLRGTKTAKTTFVKVNRDKSGWSMYMAASRCLRSGQQ